MTPHTRRKSRRLRRSWRKDVEEAMASKELTNGESLDARHWKLGCGSSASRKKLAIYIEDTLISLPKRFVCGVAEPSTGGTISKVV